jgi:putative transposase
MSKFPRSPRRLDRLYVQKPIYFVTCCTCRRRAYLANNRLHASFVEFARRAQAQFGIAVGRYVILPDHLHLFVVPANDIKLNDWVGILKRVLARSTETTGSNDPVWQRGFFDHVLRSSESYAEKWNYVRENPVRAGLAMRADDWPYSGEIVDLYFD